MNDDRYRNGPQSTQQRNIQKRHAPTLEENTPPARQISQNSHSDRRKSPQPPSGVIGITQKKVYLQKLSRIRV
jgi:hypothetical protein